MLSPFESSRMLIDRAREHFDQFDELQRSFVTKSEEGVFTEIDAETGKILCKVKPPEIDRRMPVILFDLINGLRSALDHAVFDAARVLGAEPNPERTKFPFGETIDNLRGDLKRAKDIPAALHPLLESYEPYKGGAKGLWNLNKLRNQKIHRILQPVALGSAGIGIGGNFTGALKIVQDCSRWDDDQGVLTFAILYADSSPEANAHIHPILGVSFGPPFYGANAAEAMKYMIEVVEGVVVGIKSEAARLKVEGPI